MPDPMKIRASVQGEHVDVRILMGHEMETGQRRDAAGQIVPAHFIANVTITHAGRTVLAAQWGPAVAKNPYLQFRFQGGKVGDELVVNWVDNMGETRTDRALIA